MQVKDIMLSLDNYAVVGYDATLLDVVLELEKAKGKCPHDREPHRAVLVLDKQGKVIGKVGHLAFLKALEPKYDKMGDLQLLAHAGLAPEFMQQMAEHLRIWQDSLEDVCKRARKIKARHVMVPATQSIDENALITEAIHRLVMWQTLSLLVTRQDDIVGIIRLTDVYASVAKYIKEASED